MDQKDKDEVTAQAPTAVKVINAVALIISSLQTMMPMNSIG